jgi:UDP:flavonoid glycosyltransferase YjiC (YdhE family)
LVTFRSAALVLKHEVSLTSSKHFLSIWELGGGLGHISNHLPIAQRLRERGHRVTLATKDVVTGATFAKSYDMTMLPIPERHFDIPFMPASYAEVLYTTAFGREDTLNAVVDSWHEYFRWLKPDMLICEHSPVSMFAAKLAGIPTANLGTGFFLPPATPQLPRFRDWEPAPLPRLSQIEEQVLRNVQAVQARFDKPLSSALSEVPQADLNLLVSWPALDTYQAHRPAEQIYLGPLMITSKGELPQWPQRDTASPKIFAYLKSDTTNLASMVKALANAKADTCLYLMGANDALLSMANDRLRIYTTPLNASAAFAQADLAISNAGHALIATAMLAKRPMIMIPSTAEQFIVARRAEKLGAGVTFVPAASKQPFAQVLAKQLDGLKAWQPPQLPNEPMYTMSLEERIELIVERLEKAVEPA